MSAFISVCQARSSTEHNKVVIYRHLFLKGWVNGLKQITSLQKNISALD